MIDEPPLPSNEKAFESTLRFSRIALFPTDTRHDIIHHTVMTMLLLRCTVSSRTAARAAFVPGWARPWTRCVSAPTVPLSCLARSFSTATLPDPPSSNHLHQPLLNAQGSVIYTETDEAPALATYSLYPVISKVSFAVLCKKTMR